MFFLKNSSLSAKYSPTKVNLQNTSFITEGRRQNLSIYPEMYKYSSCIMIALWFFLFVGLCFFTNIIGKISKFFISQKGLIKENKLVEFHQGISILRSNKNKAIDFLQVVSFLLFIAICVNGGSIFYSLYKTDSNYVSWFQLTNIIFALLWFFLLFFIVNNNISKEESIDFGYEFKMKEEKIGIALSENEINSLINLKISILNSFFYGISLGTIPFLIQEFLNVHMIFNYNISDYINTTNNVSDFSSIKTNLKYILNHPTKTVDVPATTSKPALQFSKSIKILSNIYNSQNLNQLYFFPTLLSNVGVLLQDPNLNNDPNYAKALQNLNSQLTTLNNQIINRLNNQNTTSIAEEVYTNISNTINDFDNQMSQVYFSPTFASIESSMQNVLNYPISIDPDTVNTLKVQTTSTNYLNWDFNSITINLEILYVEALLANNATSYVNMLSALINKIKDFVTLQQFASSPDIITNYNFYTWGIDKDNVNDMTWGNVNTSQTLSSMATNIKNAINIVNSTTKNNSIVQTLQSLTNNSDISQWNVLDIEENFKILSAQALSNNDQNYYNILQNLIFQIDGPAILGKITNSDMNLANLGNAMNSVSSQIGNLYTLNNDRTFLLETNSFENLATTEQNLKEIVDFNSNHFQNFTLNSSNAISFVNGGKSYQFFDGSSFNNLFSGFTLNSTQTLESGLITETYYSRPELGSTYSFFVVTLNNSSTNSQIVNVYLFNESQKVPISVSIYFENGNVSLIRIADYIKGENNFINYYKTPTQSLVNIPGSSQYFIANTSLGI